MAVTLIADDLTGACDAGALFAGRGRVSVILNGCEPDPGDDVVAIDTESRGLPPPEARRRVADAARRMRRRLSAGAIFKKIDSTLRGAVGEEIEALQEESGRRTALVCPTFPEQGRTVAGGLLRVHGAPAHTSAVGRDPTYPSGTSDLIEILRRGTERPVHHLPLDCVRAGRSRLAHALAQFPGGIVAADAETDADLDALAAASAELLASASKHLLVAGSAGLARAVATALGHGAPRVPLPAGRAWLIVAGSAHPATLAQIRMLRAAGVAGAVLETPREGMARTNGGASEPDVAAVVARLADGRPAFLTTGDTVDAEPDARARMAAAIADTARRVLARRRPDLVAVTGGETAHALLNALGVGRIELIGPPSSGLALAEAAPGGAPRLTLLTKAGGFGAPDLFVTLLGGIV